MEDICGTKLLLERYMSPNFFGLFVEKEQEGLLKKLTQDLCKEIRKLGVKADPIIKSFHLTPNNASGGAKSRGYVSPLKLKQIE